MQLNYLIRRPYHGIPTLFQLWGHGSLGKQVRDTDKRRWWVSISPLVLTGYVTLGRWPHPSGASAFSSLNGDYEVQFTSEGCPKNWR